jgi:hypothetical protein
MATLAYRNGFPRVSRGRDPDYGAGRRTRLHTGAHSCSPLASGGMSGRFGRQGGITSLPQNRNTPLQEIFPKATSDQRMPKRRAVSNDKVRSCSTWSL